MLNAKGKVLHVCSLDKFIPPFIDFVEEYFDDFASRHVFFIAANHRPYNYKIRENTINCGNGYINQIVYLPRIALAMILADKIVLHNLFNPYKVILLALMPWLLKKCYWVMWGGDLYVYQLGERKWKWKLSEFFRRPVIRNIGYLVTGTPGDVELARKWYGACGQHIRCFNYPSNVFKPVVYLEDKEHSGTNILVGNSADPSNNHKEVLDKLVLYKNNDIKIFCPLSYGNQEYAAGVIDYGKSIFGEKFFPMTDFLDRDKYLKYLQETDVAIFNHKRQQAFGNALMLLGYGKKVFVRKESTLNGVFEGIGLTVFNSEYIDIEKLSPELAARNSQIVIENFSKESLVASLKRWLH